MGKKVKTETGHYPKLNFETEDTLIQVNRSGKVDWVALELFLISDCLLGFFHKEIINHYPSFIKYYSKRPKRVKILWRGRSSWLLFSL